MDINKDPSKIHAEKKRKIQLKFCKDMSERIARTKSYSKEAIFNFD